MVNRNLSLASWRFFRQHRWQFWLSVLSLALGTAVIVAVDLANDSARRAFALSLDSVTGRTTHQIMAGSADFDEHIYSRLRLEFQQRQSAPVVEGWLRIQGQTFNLLGIDPFAEPMFRDITTRASEGSIVDLMTTLGGVIFSQKDAERLGIRVGEEVPAEAAGRPVTLEVIGLLGADGGAVPEGLLIADISTAQSLLDKAGRLDRIDLVLDETEAQRLRRQLPPQLQLVSAQARRGALEEMTQAFHINLTAMSLLAIVVGGFLVYNTMTFSVLQRRPQLAVQRMLGVTGQKLLIHVLLEAVIIGLLGALLGLALGMLLAQGLLSLVTRTINDLYFLLTVSSVAIHPLILLKGLAVTLMATLLAALGPAMEAGKIPPIAVSRRSELEQKSRRAVPLLALMGAVLVACGLALAMLSSKSLFIGFVALFLIILGYSIAIPWLALQALNLLLRSRRRAALWWSLALRGVQSGLSRTGLAIAALAVAVSATVGVGIMIESFRASVTDWLDTTLRSDLYVSSVGAVSSRAEGTLEAEWIDRVEGLEGVVSYSTGRSIKLDVRGMPTDALILSTGAQSTRGFDILAGDISTLWDRFRAGEAILISEPLASHQGLKIGDRLEIFSDLDGDIALPIAAVFRDYGSTQGMVVLPRNLYDRHWSDRAVSAIGLLLSPHADVEAIKQRLRDWAAESVSTVMVRSNVEIRERSLMIFDRTFAITEVLRLLAVGVAFVGVFSALMALLLEKRKEYAVLRASGVTPRLLALIMLMQTVIIGLLAGLIALPLGWLMSEVLILVINQRAFGWSMDRLLPPGVLFQAMFVALIAAVLAGLYPAQRMAKAKIASALREE